MRKRAKLMIYWDYELQTGVDQAISTKGLWDGYKEYNETEKLLLFLKQNKIKCTFAILGICAEKGRLPYNSQSQIKKIAELGHEIASHTYGHEYIPDLDKKQLRETLQKSKEILEKVSGRTVTSFTAPHNMPADFCGFSLDIKKRKRISKLSLPTLYKILASLGYKTYRNNKFTPFTNKIFQSFRSFYPQLKYHISHFNLNCPDGFGAASRQVVDHAVKKGGVAVVCAHPWALNFPGSQSWDSFKLFVKYIKSLEQEQKLEITTPCSFL